MKLTVGVLVLAVLVDCTDVLPPEYRFKRYVYRKKPRSVKYHRFVTAVVVF